MASYINIRINIRLTIAEGTHENFVRYLSVSDSMSIGILIDEINGLLSRDNIEGDIYFVFDQALDNPYSEDTLLGGTLFPRELLLIYTMIESGSTLFVDARVRNNGSDATNQIKVYGRIYIQETGERLNDMILNIPEGHTIGMLVNYINAELARQHLQGQIYYMANEEGFTVSEDVRLGGVNYPLEKDISDTEIRDNSLLYMNCSVTNPFFRNLFVQPQQQQQQHLPILNIYENTQVVDLNSFLDVYDALLSVNGFRQEPGQRVIDETLTGLNSLSSLVQILSNPIFTNVEALGMPRMDTRRMEDIIVGLDKGDLEKLKLGIYTEFEERDKHDRDMCSICFEKFVDTDMCRELKCKHLYHQKCIDTWLDEHITCPVCREECGKGVPRL